MNSKPDLIIPAGAIVELQSDNSVLIQPKGGNVRVSNDATATDGVTAFQWQMLKVDVGGSIYIKNLNPINEVRVSYAEYTK